MCLKIERVRGEDGATEARKTMFFRTVVDGNTGAYSGGGDQALYHSTRRKTNFEMIIGSPVVYVFWISIRA